MAPTKAPASNPLSHRLGPLPVWGWLGLAVVGYLLYKHYSSSTSSGSTGSTALAPTSATEYITEPFGYSGSSGGGGGTSTGMGGTTTTTTGGGTTVNSPGGGTTTPTPGGIVGYRGTAPVAPFGVLKAYQPNQIPIPTPAQVQSNVAAGYQAFQAEGINVPNTLYQGAA